MGFRIDEAAGPKDAQRALEINPTWHKAGAQGRGGAPCKECTFRVDIRMYVCIIYMHIFSLFVSLCNVYIYIYTYMYRYIYIKIYVHI